ncbi:MAG: succinate dehydrogenase, hydrophobic membrane anchor protein [Steroidobacteraceae bacterium]|jgi:succinate dehydrogenase / fumarate reductase membrane anchor subunit
MSLRPALGTVLGSGSARAGVEHWWSQRVSAVASALLGLWFIYSLLTLPSLDRQSLIAWLADPVSAALMLLFLLASFWHSALGVQVVIEDYVHDKALRVASLLAARYLHLLAGAAAAVAVLKLSFGEPA